MTSHVGNSLIQRLHKYGSKTIYRTPDEVQYSEKEYYRTIQDWQVSEVNLLSDIYFVVNLGGTTGGEIERYVAVFVDLDAGKGPDEKYKSTEEVDAYKADRLALIDDFPLEPSAIVDTRNGLHVYWILAYDTPEHMWRRTMVALIEHFDGDPQAKNPSRLMRLPGTNWVKPKSGLPPYPVTLLKINDLTYHIEEIHGAIPVRSVDPGPISRTEQDAQAPMGDRSMLAGVPATADADVETAAEPETITGTDLARLLVAGEESSRITLIRTGSSTQLAKTLKFAPTTVHSRAGGVEHLVQSVSLRRVLDVPQQHRCLFHDDRQPSAGIFRSDRGEDYLKCQSTRCGFEGNLVTVVKRLRGCATREAIDFLLDACRVRVVESETIMGWRRNLESNLRYVASSQLALDHPAVARSVGCDLDVLEALTKEGLANLLFDEQAGPDGLPTFFASVRYLADHLGIPERSLQRSLLRLRLHGLVRCRPQREVPHALLDRANKHAAQHGAHHLVNFYVLPILNANTMAVAHERASILEAYPLHRDGQTWEGIYRTFGPELATSVFPEREGHRPSAESEDLTNELLDATERVLATHGWVCEEYVVSEARSSHRTSRVRRQFRVAEHQIARELGLRSVFADRDARERLRVPGHIRRVLMPVHHDDVERRSAA